MCGPHHHRREIEALLHGAASRGSLRDCVDADELTEFCAAILREHYSDLCSEGCMRERAADFAQRPVARRLSAREPIAASL